MWDRISRSSKIYSRYIGKLDFKNWSYMFELVLRMKTTPSDRKSLKWYCDQKVTLPFVLYFESMYYRYLPGLILSHDFDEKFDFLNYEFS